MNARDGWLVGCEVRFYDVTNRIPKAAVKEIDVTLNILMFGVKSEISLALATYLHGT